MFCTKCGKQIDDEAIMCPHCGTMIDKFSKSQKKTKSGNKTWIVVLGIILAVGGALNYVMSYTYGNWQRIGISAVWLLAGVCMIVYWLYNKTDRRKDQPPLNAAEQSPVPIVSEKLTMPAPDMETKFKPEYEYHKIRLVGVTFKNEDGSRRQTLLRDFRFRDPPFDGETVDVDLVPYEFEGEPAMAVDVNGKRLGHVPKERARYFCENIHRSIGITGIDVIGGGYTEEGEPLNYGAEVTIKLRKE